MWPARSKALMTRARLGLKGRYDKLAPEDQPRQYEARKNCLNNTETRTHWFWHILYGTGVQNRA